MKKHTTTCSSGALLRFFKAIQPVRLLAVSVLLISGHISFAGSATWKTSPGSGNWNTATNWTPQTVPDGVDQTATFDASNVTDVNIASDSVDSIVFNPGASAFTFSLGRDSHLSLFGAGIVNNSGVTQTFELFPPAFGGPINFNGRSKAGPDTVFNMKTSSGGGEGAQIYFVEDSSADNAVFNVGAALRAAGTYEARVFFFNGAKAGQAHFNMFGARLGEADGGSTEFLSDDCSAETAIFTANGGEVDQAFGGQVVFNNSSHAANSTLIANGGVNGGYGGRILFVYQSVGENARVQLYGNGLLDISLHRGRVTVGSIEGDGLVSVGANALRVGNNNVDTTFSGVIRDGGGLSGDTGGSLTKVGTGRLTLTGENLYSGRTTVKNSRLLVNNASGSGTGTGPVFVNAGALGGSGIVAGAVTVGDGGGRPAFLLPGANATQPGKLTIQSGLTFNSDATYKTQLDSSTAQADKVVANGVTINGGAQFRLEDLGAGTLPLGTIFVVINNASASPIAGTFVNLPNGATFTTNGNTFRADYQGGDGNDLTLKVQ